MDVRRRTPGPWRRAAVFLVAGCLAVVGATGCGGTDDEYNPPGANARVGQVLIRYAHIAEPSDGPWEQGDDATDAPGLTSPSPDAATPTGR